MGETLLLASYSRRGGEGRKVTMFFISGEGEGRKVFMGSLLFLRTTSQENVCGTCFNPK